MAAQEKATKLTEEANSESKKRVTILSDLEKAQQALTKAQSEEAIAVQKLRVETQELNKRNKEQAKEVLGLVTPYQKFAKEVNEAKKNAKNLGAEMIDLEKRLKSGEISQKEYNRQINKLSADYVEATVKAKGLDSAVKKIDGAVGDSQRNVGNYKSMIGGLTVSFRNLIAAFGVYSAIDIFAELGRSSFETVKNLNAQNAALTQVFETEAQVAFQREYLSKITDQYGLNLISTTDAYTKFSAAVRGSALEGEEARKIFTAFAGASAKLALSADQQAGIFRALEQMISKGKIQAEELRGQLGDRMAGAFKLFADSLGVTTMELDEMLKKGEVLAADTLPKAAEELGKLYDLSARAETLTSAQERFRNSWTEFLNNLASNKELINDLSSGFETLTEVVSFLIDTLISDGSDGASVVGDLVNILEDLFGVITDVAGNLGMLDEKQNQALFSMRQMKADFMQVRSVALALGGMLEYLAETLGNLFKLGEGWDAYIKRSNDAYDKLMAKLGQYRKMQADSKIIEKGGLIEPDEHAKAWEKARKSKQDYFQLNGKYFNTATGRNTGKGVDDYIDRDGKLVAKPKYAPGGGGGGDKAAADALKAAKKAEREAAAARRKEEQDAKRQERERLEAEKRRFERERDNIEALYKVRLESVKNNLELAKQDPYSSESDKLANQMNYYSELIKLNDSYYGELIKNAQRYNAQVGEKDRVSISDIEVQRDTKAGGYSNNRDSLGLKTSEALQKDLELSRQIEDSYRNAGFEESKRLILSDKRLSQRQREYQLSLLENMQAIELREIKLQQARTDLEALNAKEKVTIDEQARTAELAETIIVLGNEIENLNQATENLRTENLAETLQPLADMVSNGLSDLGFAGAASEFDSFYKTILDKTSTFEEKMKESMELIGAFASDLIQRQTEQRIAALDAQLEASQAATDQELGFINSRLEQLNSLSELTKEQFAERNALEDEARTLREQQLEREKTIEKQKAKAQQRAAAQQAIIGGAVGAAQALPNLYLAAASLLFGGVMAALIMSKDPVPQYFVGRRDGPEEMALTQERGREIITDKKGRVKSLGSDKGATLTKLGAGDKVFTASESLKMFSQFPSLNVGDNIHKIDNSRLSPIILNQNIDYDILADKIKNGYEQVMRKYDKTTTFEDEDGNIYKQKGGQIPQFLGKKREQRQKIEIKIRNKNVRD